MLAVSEKTENNENSPASAQAEPLFLQPRRRRTGRRVVRAAGAAGARHISVQVDQTPAEAQTPAPSHDDQVHARQTHRGGTNTAATLHTGEETDRLEMPAAHPRRRRAHRMSLDDIKLPEASATRASRHTSSAASGDGDAVRADAHTDSDARAQQTKTRKTKTQQTEAQQEQQDRSRRTAAIAAELFSDAGVAEPRTAPAAASSARSTRSGSSRRPVVSQHRPMASLLFQAPDLGVSSDQDQSSDDEDLQGQTDATPQDSQEAGTRLRRRRRSRSHAHRSERHTADRAEEDAVVRSAGASDEDRAGSTEAVENDDARTTVRRRRRTRLNASERAAAAEVKFIEDDIARDAVRAEALAEDEEAGVSGVARSEEEPETHDGLRVRRRARREHTREDHRSAVSERTATAARPAAGSRRQREKAYISKIKDVSGSTRLEAKRRRRRETRRDRTRQSFLLEQEAMARREHVDRQMVVRERGRHTQISVIEDNILVEHYVSDIDEVSTVGNIYVGRVQNVLPGMEAAFVNIGEARNGVLYSGEVNWDAARLEGKPRRIELAYHSGDPIMVQVTKDPIGHKGARLTAQITLAGRYIVLVPSGAMTGVSRKLPERERTRLRQIVAKLTPKNMGVIIRTAADGASQEAIEKDFETLLTRWKNVQDRYEEFKDTHRPHILHREPDVAIRVVRDIFNDDFRRLVVEGDSVYRRISDYLEEMSPDQLDKLEKWDPEEHHGADVFDEWKIDSQLRKGMERKVYLPSGGSLVIDRTEAMTTIDVNTGRFVGKGKSLEEIVTRVNLEAAEEIVRQLRLRDIGGMIMIDFVDMVMAENRDLVLRRLIECLSRDRTKHQVAEVTSLGLVQMTRKRVGQGLVEAFSQECPTCHGRGFILHDDPTIEINAADPYEAKGGDPFEKSRDARREVHRRETHETAAPKGSSAEVRRKLAQIAAAATREDEAQEQQHTQDRA